MQHKYPPELVEEMVEALVDVATDTNCMKMQDKEVHRVHGCVLGQVRDVLNKIAEVNRI